MTLLVPWKGAIPISRPYDVYGAQDAVREADDLPHEYEPAHHRDDDGDDGDGHVPHVHAYDCGVPHRDAHILEPKHWLESAKLDWFVTYYTSFHVFTAQAVKKIRPCSKVVTSEIHIADDVLLACVRHPKQIVWEETLTSF